MTFAFSPETHTQILFTMNVEIYFYTVKNRFAEVHNYF